MQISMGFYKNILIISPIGELDHHSIEKHAGEADRCFRMKSFKNIIFDLGQVTFIDSSGIGFILGRYKLALLAGGKTALTNVSDQVRRLASISGILKIINIYPSVDKAIESLTRGGDM